MEHRVIVTLTGPSGAGKSTLERMLVNTGEFERVISVTTRPARNGEVDGKDYHFVSKERFEALLADEAFLETANFNGNWYGATDVEFERIFDMGKTPVVVVEPKGRAQIQYRATHFVGARVLAVFVDGSPRTLIARMIGREKLVDEAATLALSQRIHVATTTEIEWRREAYDSFHQANPAYDVVFGHFDESNQGDVVETIKAAVVEQRLLSRYNSFLPV
jgi:guanylate kinase